MSAPQPKDIVPVILAGGEGRRLRPLTSRSRAKPFLKLFAGRSLLQEAALCVRPFAPPIIILHDNNQQQAEQQLHEIEIKSTTLICEPSNQGTTAAIAMAAFHLQGQEVVMAVMPSDHIIADSAAFQTALKHAAGKTGITSLGVQPSSPSTRYGYIQTQQGKITNFVEKPSVQKAREMIASANCFWNTGIFSCAPEFFLQKLKQFRPDIFEAAQKAYRAHEQNDHSLHFDAQLYTKIPSQAVDYAIMENLDDAQCIELKSHWNDLGTWPTLMKVMLFYAFKKLSSERQGYESRTT